MGLAVRIIDPDKVVFEGEAEFLTAPGNIVELGIFPGHTPFYGELVTGEIVIHITNTEMKSVPLEKGILKVQNDKIVILITPKIDPPTC